MEQPTDNFEQDIARAVRQEAMKNFLKQEFRKQDRQNRIIKISAGLLAIAAAIAIGLFIFSANNPNYLHPAYQQQVAALSPDLDAPSRGNSDSEGGTYQYVQLTMQYLKTSTNTEQIPDLLGKIYKDTSFDSQNLVHQAKYLEALFYLKNNNKEKAIELLKEAMQINNKYYEQEKELLRQLESE